MTTSAHAGMAGVDLHENKGVAAATDNTVATAVGGATTWAKLTASNLTGTGNPFGAQLLNIQDQKTSGTSGGDPSAANTWLTRALNTVVTNEISSASLAANQITLPAGTYFIQGMSMAYSGHVGKTRLRNITDSSTAVVGLNLYTQNTSSAPTPLVGRFTLSGTKVLELQMYLTDANVTGFGIPASSGEVEVYSVVLIWKVA